MMDFQKYLLFLHTNDQITKQPRNMKLRTTISLLALAAMFAFSTPAEAQWGSLIKGARKTLGIKTKKEKREEAALKEQQRKRDSVEAVIKSITPTIPQPAPEGTRDMAILWQGKTKIGKWDPVNLEITFNKKYDDGPLAGEFVKYVIDPMSGIVKSSLGNEVGRISNDGTIVTSKLGTLNYDNANGKVSYNGEVIGNVNMQKALCYSQEVGSFDGHVSPLLVAFTFIGALLSPEQVEGFHTAKIKMDQEAAARAEKARQEQQAREEARRKEWESLNCVISGSNGITQGYVRSNGVVENSSHITIGYIKQNGVIENASHITIGYVLSNGTVEQSNRITLGYFDGRTFEKSNRITCGYYSSGTFENSNRITIGRFSGKYNQTVIAACFFFFFFPKEVNK